MSERVRAHLMIAGVVQGVYFRASTARMAMGLNVDGWVRNLPDGRVEATFEGPAGAVTQAIAWARTGPPRAVVESAEIEFEEPHAERGFRIL
ncbi:MAG: acylphosphatase [Actinobacteria bacterium]|nr:MAG: acylphosphatase [Actinomycetota bacterium]